MRSHVATILEPRVVDTNWILVVFTKLLLGPIDLLCSQASRGSGDLWPQHLDQELCPHRELRLSAHAGSQLCSQEDTESSVVTCFRRRSWNLCPQNLQRYPVGPINFLCPYERFHVVSTGGRFRCSQGKLSPA